MDTQPVRSMKDIARCVEMYAERNIGLPLSTGKALMRLETAVKRGRFVRGAYEEGVLRAFLYAELVDVAHIDHPVLQQMYYCSDLQGLTSARAVRLLHEELLEHAEDTGVRLVTSPGSHLDENLVFPKLLERYGWERLGYIAYKYTSHHEETTMV